MNLTLRLWSGCLDTAKILSLRTQSGNNTKEIRRLSILTVHSRAANDPIYRKGVVIAYLWNRYHKCIKSAFLVWVSNIAAVAPYPKNQPFAVPGLRTKVFPTFLF